MKNLGTAKDRLRAKAKKAEEQRSSAAVKSAKQGTSARERLLGKAIDAEYNRQISAAREQAKRKAEVKIAEDVLDRQRGRVLDGGVQPISTMNYRDHLKAVEALGKSGSFGGKSSGEVREGFDGLRLHGSRVSNTMTAAGKQYGGSMVNALGTALDNMGQQRRPEIHSDDPEKQAFIQAAAEQERKRQDGLVKSAGGLYQVADRLAESGQKDAEEAKRGLGSFGQFAVDVGVGGAQLAGDIGAGRLTGLGPMALMMVRSFGSAAQQARKDGASAQDAARYGLASAAVEAATEKISSLGKFSTEAFGSGAVDDILNGVVGAVERLGKTEAGRAVLNRVASTGVGFLAEGFEEFISGIADPILQKASYGKEMPEIKETVADALYDFLVGGAIGAVSGGIGGTDTTGVQVENYENTVNRETDRAYQAMKEKGMFSQEGREEVRRAQEAISRARGPLAWEDVPPAGEIDQEGRETVSGQEKTAPVEAVSSQQEKVGAEQPQRKRLAGRFKAAMEAEGASFMQAEQGGVILSRAAAGETVTPDQRAMVQTLPGGARLLETAERMGAQAQAETEGVAQRLGSALGRTIRVYDGAAAQGTAARANGYIQDGVLYINSRSRNPAAQIIAHELTHSLEGAESYGDLHRVVVEEIRRTGGDVDALLQEKVESYARQDVKLTVGEAENEVVAEYIEKHLLTDEESIRTLVQTNRTLGQRIRAYLDHLLAKLGSASAKERDFVRRARDLYTQALLETAGKPVEVNRSLEELRRAYANGEISEAEFDEAMDAIEEQEGLVGDTPGERKNSFGGESYSISETLETDLRKVMNGTFRTRGNEVYIGETSNFLTDVIGADALTVTMPTSKAYSAMATEEQAKADGRYNKDMHYHGLGIDGLTKVLEASENPVAAFADTGDEKRKRAGNIVLVTGEMGADGSIVVVEALNTTGYLQGRRIEANKVVTSYDRRTLANDIMQAAIDGRLLYLDKKRSQTILAGVSAANPQRAIQEVDFKKNIQDFWANVKWAQSGKSVYTSGETGGEKTAFARAYEKAQRKREALPEMTNAGRKGGQKFSFPENEAQDNLPLNTKAEDQRNKVERRLVAKVGKLLNVPTRAQRGPLRDIAREISTEMLSTGTVSQETTDRLFDRAWDEGVVVAREFAEENAELERHLRGTRFVIAPEDAANIPDFNRWRQAHFGRLNISTKGEPNLNRLYEELSHNWPEVFSADITHPADQLERMGDVALEFRTVEKSLEDHYGPEAETFKAWAKNDFRAAVEDTISQLREVRRYAQDREDQRQRREADREAASEATLEEMAKVWADLKTARRTYEKAAAKALLTEHDQAQVSRLLRGEIQLDNLDPRRDNVRAITAVVEAKREYDRLTKQVKAWNAMRKAELREEADSYLGTALSWKDKSAGWKYSRETMERNLRDIIPDRAVADEITRKYIIPVHTAAADATRMKNGYRQRVEQLLLSRKVAQGNIVSEAHAVQLLGEAEDNIRMLEKSRRRDKTRDGKTLEEWRAVVNDLWAENPNLDQGKIRRAVEEFRTIYDELFRQMNEVRMRNGYEPVNYRQGYFPHFQPGRGDGIMGLFGKALGIQTEVTAIPTSINGLTHTFKPGIQWFGNAQERLGFNTAYDAVEGFDRYIEGVADVIHQTDNIQRLRALATQVRYRSTDDGIREQVDKVRENPNLTEEEKEVQIKEIYEKGKFSLANFVVELEEYTNLLANKKSSADRNMEQRMGRDLYNLAKALESRVAANMVALNPASWLTNFIPLTQGWSVLDSRSLLAGMWDTLKAYKSGDGIVERSDFLTNRRGSDPLVKTWSQKWSSTMSTPMEIIDNFTADSLVRARYGQNLRRGIMTEEEALAEADAWVAKVMADRSKGSMPTVFSRRNPLTKAFTQFQLEVNNQMSYLWKDVPDELKEKGMKALLWGLLKFALGAYLYNEVYEFFIGRRPALDPIEMLNDTVGDVSGYEVPNLVELAGGAAGLNEMPSFQVEKKGPLETVATRIKEAAEELPFVGGVLGGGRIPLSSALPDGGKIVSALNDEDRNWKRIGQVARDELLEKPVAYLAAPFGGGQVKKAVEGIEAAVKGGSYTVNTKGEDILQYPVFGKTAGEKIGNAVKGAVFGKSSFPEARKWVESGFDSLSAKETAAYREMTRAGEDGERAYSLIRELQDMKIQEKLAAAAEAGLEDEAAMAVAGLILGTDLETEAGNPTRYAMLKEAAEVGLSPSAGLDLLAREGKLDRFLEARKAGAGVQAAVDTAVALGTLDPEEGQKSVSKLQQYRIVAELPFGERDKEVEMRTAMTETAYAKYQAARDAGVSTYDYVRFLEEMAEVKADKDKDGKTVSGSKKEKVLAIIDRIGGGKTQKDALYLAAGYSEKTLDEAPWN